MNRNLFLSLIIGPVFVMACRSENGNSTGREIAGNDAVVQLTGDAFRKKIFNYEAGKEWKYEGTMPAIVDFYATWCGPCRQLSPMVEEVAKQFAGRIIVYKVDTDKESVLAQNMGISGLPTLLFIPAKGSPQMTMGLIPKETLIKAINEVLQVK